MSTLKLGVVLKRGKLVAPTIRKALMVLVRRPLSIVLAMIAVAALEVEDERTGDRFTEPSYQNENSDFVPRKPLY